MAKLRGPNVTVGEFGTHRSPFAAECRCRRPETVDTGRQKSDKFVIEQLVVNHVVDHLH